MVGSLPLAAARLLSSVSGHAVYGMFDNLEFTSGGSNGGGDNGNTVPEPATLALFGFGLAGVIGANGRRQS